MTKASLKPTRKRWEEAFAYIESQPGLHDIVVSGGDSYYLQPDQLSLIGERLISMPNIKRFRFASKGLAVAPTRILDESDGWVNALIDISNKAKKAGKSMALHTHFNHPNEISWISRDASQKLYEAGVMVRNQAVLLRGVNDDFETMSTLIRDLADNHIFPVRFSTCFSGRRGDADMTTVLHLPVRYGGEGRAPPDSAADDSRPRGEDAWLHRRIHDAFLCRRLARRRRQASRLLVSFV